MSEAELKRLERKRATFKAKLTTTSTFVNDTKVNFEGYDAGARSAALIEVQLRIDKLEEVFIQYEETQGQIEALTDKFDDELLKREQVETAFYKVVALMKQLVQEKQTKDEDVWSRARSSQSVRSNNNEQEISNQIKLPQIKLPHFSGSYDSWLEFRDTFQSLIHDNEQVGQIQKFHYLRAALQGNAAQVIHAIEFTAANYKLAWDSLIERYDNTSVLIHTHVKGLFNLPQLLKESSAELRSFVDQISKNLRSLEILGQPTDQWDTLLVYLVTSKLDTKTMREWEEKKGNEIPTFEDMKKFLRTKSDLLETLDLNKNIEKQKPQSQKSKAYLATAASKCPLCQQEHQLFNCGKFLTLSPQQRLAETFKFKLCINCLKNGHYAKECKSRFRCKKCKAAHNSLLHVNQEVNREIETQVKETGDEPPIACKLSSALKPERLSHQILLSTALVQVTDASGKEQVCRALLDSGAQSNFISTEACKRLGLLRKPVTAAVSGISQTTLPIKQRCELRIQSQYNNFTQAISCLVIGSISEELPSEEVHTCNECIPSYIKLADPTYSKPGKVDLILGAGIFWTLLCIGQHRVGKGSLLLQKTVLGWVMTGTAAGSSKTNKIACHFGRNVQVQNQLELFWKIEEPKLQKTFTRDEQRCEDIFVKTVSRNNEGRFVVTMPLKHNSAKLGESKHIAIRRLHSMERRLNNDSALKAMYVQFMEEYESLNHMSEMLPKANEVCNYLPHHAVKNESSSTTKLRVVFDGSAKTESGWSFNDLQLVGPTVQDDLWSIILRFRQHTFVVCADIQKMYRQILIDPKQRNLQCIVWRFKDNEEVKTFQLNTITYGTASAPYLATRCLRQLSEENQATLPQASKVIRSDFYVDDMVTGSNNLQTLTQTISEVIVILQSAGLELRKWVSNSDQLIKDLHKETSSEVLEFGKNDHTKTLGIYWSSSSDVFSYNIGEGAKIKNISKRMILSETAQLFDPLGLVSPCIIQAKMLLQKLWVLKLSWDESVPQEIYTAWKQFREQLIQLNYVSVPRHITVQDAKTIELHGFSDASQNAYGACIYVRTISEGGEIKVRLLTAKSKVAPLKALTIPRLELCAALVLSQLVQKIQASLSMTFHESYYWTDSSVVLHWLKTNSKQLQPFVSNRVSQIQEGTRIEDWSYIKTKDNPADFVSRGMNPNDLLKCTMWWHGPSWLMESRENWPQTILNFEGEPLEVKKNVNVFMAKINKYKFPFETFSDVVKMKRVMVYIIRYMHNCRLRIREGSTKHIYSTVELKEAIRNSTSISTEELEEATKRLIKLCQKEEFMEEVKALQQQKEFPKSCLQKLNPFLDSKGIMRVGGRIQLSQATLDQKHPILLPKKHRLTYLLIKHYHEQLLHAGAQATLYAVRELYWPIAGRNLTKRIIHSCITCYKTQPKSITPIMGILPKARVTQAFPFENTGVDYAGPLIVKGREGRGVKTTKAYVCLFICMCTKAVHIELVSSLTKEAFLAALRRFASRRGKPRNIYSDNGTNFVAANKELAELLKVANQEIQTKLSTEGITWHFNPPYAPHFGGLWEAGIKSIKYHLKRVVGNSILTYENLQTVLIQIEGILNSRPLLPLSNDPTDLQALTPAHFLIGKSLVSVVDPDTTHIRENRLSKFQHLQQIQQHFWARWNKEFISELQTRLKWRTQTTPLAEGALVIVKEDNSPPLHWHLGRVTKVVAGPDGVPRVAELKTPHGIIKRAFSKICPLPMDNQCCEVE